MSFIKKEIIGKLREAGISLELSRLASPMTIKVGNESYSKSEFSVTIPLYIEGFFYPTTFYILDRLPFCFILGLDFMENYGVQISFPDKTFYLDPDSLSLPNSKDDQIFLFLHEDLFIPPFCEALTSSEANKHFTED